MISHINLLKTCRKNIRQALNKGVTYRVTKSPENIDSFKEIYYSFDVIFYEGVEDLANKILTSSYQNVKYSSQHEYQFVKVVEKILNRIEDR